MRNILISILLFAGVSAVQADEEVCTPSQPETPKALFVKPAEIECIGRLCYYIPKKASSTTLIRELEKSVTGSTNNTLRPHGFIETGRESGELSFWHKCQEKVDEMKLRVVQLDSAIGSLGRERVFVKIRVLHITNQALSNFSFGITGLFDGLVETAPPKASVANSGGGFDMNLSFGNLTNHLFNIRLSQAKGTNQAYSAKSIPFDIMEGENLSQSLLQDQYRDGGANGLSDVVQAQTGYNFGGRPFIDPTTGRVVIKDFSVFYAKPSSDIQNFGPETLNVRRLEVMPPREGPHVIVGDEFTVSTTDKSKGLPFYLQDSTVKSDSKILIFITAWPAANPPEGKKTTAVSLTAEQIKALPEQPATDFLQIKEDQILVLNSESENSEFGLLGLQLDSAGLSKNNYNELVNISMTGPDGYVRESNVQAQHLANGIFQVPSMYSKGAKPEVELKLRIAWRFPPKNKPRGFKKSVTYELLHIQDVWGGPQIKILKRSFNRKK